MLPNRFVERPLTLPMLTLSPSFSIGYEQVSVLGASFDSSHVIGGSIGASLGLGPATITALVLPVDVDPKARFGHAQLAATIRFLRGLAEVGASASLGFASPDEALWLLGAAVPVHIHAARWIRVDTGVELTALIAENDTAILLAAPLTLSFQLGRTPAFVGVSTAFSYLHENDPFQFPIGHGYQMGTSLLHLQPGPNSFVLPLGFQVGGTVPGRRGPIVDFSVTLNFPDFLAVNHVGSFVYAADIWQIETTVRFYFFFRQRPRAPAAGTARPPPAQEAPAPPTTAPPPDPSHPGDLAPG